MTPKLTKKAYSYIRFSTPEQAKGDSLRRQTELSTRYASEHGLTLDDKLTFRDLGKSAFRGRNVQEGELGDFIRAVESERIKSGSYLLIENLDRLSRQPARKAYRQLERIVELGITLVTLHDRKVYTEASLDESFTDLMYALMVLQRGHEESATKSIRVKAAWANKRRRAIESGAPMTAALPAWVLKDATTGSLKLHPERSKVVKRIFEEAAKGMGHHALAKRLNRAKVPPISTKKNSKSWHSSYIQKILSSPAVIGHSQPHKFGANGKRVPEGDVLPDYYPRVISDSLYYKVRDMRASKRTPSGPKGSNGGSLFTGLAQCASCGSAMHKVNKGTGPKGGQYLVCGNAQRGNGCVYKTWRLEDFELLILEGIREKVDWRNLGSRIEEHSVEIISALEKEHATKRVKLDRIERTLRGIAEETAADHAEGHAASPTLREARRKAESEHAALSREIEDIQERLAIEQDKAARAGVSAKDASKAFHEWLAKFSLAAGRRVHRHAVRVSDEAKAEARDHLKLILRDLVRVIECNPETNDVFVFFHHDPVGIGLFFGVESAFRPLLKA